METSAPRVARIDLDTGRVLETVSAGEYAVLVAGGRKRLVLRLVEEPRKADWRLLMFELDGTAAEGPEVRGFDLFNHPFPMRRSSRPYALVGTDPEWAHRGLWVAAVGADGTLRPLFPHSWVPQEHHFGGPAVEIGESMVYAGSVYEPQGHGPGGSYIVRRSLDGAVLWEHRADHPATALDSDGEAVYATDNSGALTALDAATGVVLWRTAASTFLPHENDRNRWMPIDSRLLPPGSGCATRTPGRSARSAPELSRGRRRGGHTDRAHRTGAPRRLPARWWRRRGSPGRPGR
ncbi:PQQ-binding-like beta-propeller repeat protein [Streptomyces sp. NPDC048257]|uniref:outer membrane protein assembly factor BamB family protein n=1 Tax=Streptomyces sp. NPDC048257 TaxID=3365526 RepID=UPI00371102CC